MDTLRQTICIDWRLVDGWPYEVSSDGHVRRTEDGGSPIAKAGRFLKPATDEDGYHCVTLCHAGRVKTVKVHVLVCTAFNGSSSDPEMQVRHLDGMPTNNRPSNLRWGTALENAADRELHGRQMRGERSARALLSQAQVNQLRLDYAQAQAGRRRVPRGWIARAAAALSVSPFTVSCICGGRGYQGTC